MKQEEIELLAELEEKEELSEKEFAKYRYLLKKKESEDRAKQFRINQQESYSSKKSRAVNLAWEFFRNVEVDGQCYVAVGGLDSITLYLFLRSIGIDVPAVSVSCLEDKSIQKVHKALGIIPLKPIKSKVSVIREYGWPVLSKEVAGKISHIQHPTEKNATVRHAIVTGETGAQGGYTTGSRMQLREWILRLFGGSDPEGKELGYNEAPFLVSDKCCYYLKELPCEKYKRDTGRWPYMGLMASEGGRREKALAINGCNYISPNTKRSCPFATFYRDDLLRLTEEMEIWYQEHWKDFRPYSHDGSIKDPIHLDTIVPEIYGQIKTDNKGIRYTTDAQRTGCSMCGFGIHMEKRPHRFDMLWERNPKEWEFWMKKVDQLDDGTWYGWGLVLDYIGVKWEDPQKYVLEKRYEDDVEQMTLFGEG